MTTKTDALGKWTGILSIYLEAEYLTGKHTKCPLCGGRDRFRYDNKDGNGSYYCNSCGAGTGIHLLAQHQGITHSEAWRLVEQALGTVKNDVKIKSPDRKAIIAEILATATAGSELVSQYLASRGIQNAPESLQQGFYWLEGTRRSAMIAKAARGQKLAGLHLTFIDDGKKLGRRMYAVEQGSMAGSAVRLHKLNGSDAIVIGEGIETSLSAAQITGLPAWAALDAGKLEAVQIPDQIKRVVIAGDSDHSYTGQAAAYALAKRLKHEGKSVEVMIPDEIGKDWNDQHRKN